MSLFDNRIVRGQCGDAVDGKHRKRFLSGWDSMILRRSQNWLIIREKERQSTYPPQLNFVGSCCEYTGFMVQQTRNLKGEKGARQKLDLKIPWLGPRFLPPTYMSQKRHFVSPDVSPDLAYLKALTILHPVFFDELNFCPRCNATGSDLSWGGWTTSGPRDVHGVYGEEQVIGVQMRCNKCKVARGKADVDDDEYNDPSYCWGTASYPFWERKEHWEIPNGVPHVKWRSAVTSELYDLIIELRPDLTSAGLAEHIKQLHLLEYHKRRREYLTHFEARAKQQAWPAKEVKLQQFSEPHTGRHQEGYDNTSISDELITDIYLDWSKATRQGESEESLQTKTGVALSIDATFRTASKATVTDKGNTHTSVYKGGITTVLNEETIIVAWRFCFTQGNWELQELLQGIKRRLTLLGVSEPDMVISDCCCHVAKAIHEVFPDAVVCLDVWHLLMRYLICLAGGSKCPVRANVARDIVDAVLKCRALEKTPAMYWSKEEQEARLEAAFKKWDSKGVWTAAGAKTHQEQLAHVRKGCLTRPRDDVRTDGSRIEGSHKGWNSLQRSFSSGIEMMAALGHDFVLRHNTRVERALKEPPKFTRSTFGSHHIRLVNDCAHRWNKQLTRKDNIDSGMEPLPVLSAPRSGETFGMMKMSPETAAHQSLASIKKEPVDEEQGLLDLTSQDSLDPNQILSGVGVDPSLLYQLPQASGRATSPPAQLEPLASSSMTPHPCTRPHDTVGLDASPPCLSSSPPRPVSDRVCTVSLPGPSQSSLPGPSQPLPDDNLPMASQPSQNVPPLLAFTPGPATPSSEVPLATSRSQPTAEIVDVDALYDPDGRDQKAAVMEAASTQDDRDGVQRQGKGVDRKGKAVDRSAMQTPSEATSTRKCRLHESGNTTGQVDNAIEIPSGDESEGATQPKPPPRKKLRLHVPGTPAAAKTKPATAPSDSTCAPSTSHSAAPSENPYPGATLDSFLQPQSQSSTQLVIVPNTTYFPRPTISGLTRSQRLFSVASGGIDPRSLSLASIDYDEFKLFLQLRARGKWATYSMTPYNWVCAASVYNKELEELNQSTHLARPFKTPRALMEKLFELEPKLIARMISANYASRSGHSPMFWHPHCHAFPLHVGGTSATELTAKLVNGKKISTKVHTCHRCKRIMYPGPTNSKLNHARGVCSDQVWQSARIEKAKDHGKVVPALEGPPPFPQPEKLFTADKDGHYFHVDRLFKLLRDFYVRIITGVAGSGQSAMYDVAFAGLLQDRVKVLDVSPTSPMVVLFRPYRNVKSIGVEDGQTYSYCGEEWIRLDDLSDSNNNLDNLDNMYGNLAPQTGTGVSQPGSSQFAQPGPSHAGTSQSPRAGSSQPDVSRASSSQLDMSRASSSQLDMSRASSSQPDMSRASSSQPQLGGSRTG